MRRNDTHPMESNKYQCETNAMPCMQTFFSVVSELNRLRCCPRSHSFTTSNSI